MVSDAAWRLYDRLRPWQDGDEDGGWVLLRLCEARAQAAAKSTDALRHDDNGSGWRRFLDPLRTPAWALPWLAQWVGSPTLVGLNETDQRTVVVTAPNLRRGTRPAMELLIRLYLADPSAQFDIVERDGSAYRFAVHTYTSTTLDPSALEQALRAVKPTGLVLSFTVTDGWIVQTFERAYDGQTVADFESDWASVDEFEDHIPPAPGA